MSTVEKELRCHVPLPVGGGGVFSPTPGGDTWELGGEALPPLWIIPFVVMYGKDSNTFPSKLLILYLRKEKPKYREK